ncbi:hypothetical protein BT96DRAFT_979690 [Gymnopus androsaceus JB14]|uniref:Late embryogenesis abundant protein LEA-2 subgroup domain-containing protein n=1 Tax=Gymnopus androsaceus JB14 TaxID=1447944 RepID=A0A6A4H2B4_9AGAR|nr:hypothetical protein BT96DRAFT_979690 [Gymnopus androsaceus JB14]
MDSDRKSTVSSFYGGRKGSMDALNNDFPSPSGQNYQTQARGRDDASSFFNPDRASRNLDGAGRASTAGYNRGSFFFAGREEPLKGGRDEEEEAGGGAWDIYADFNNTGPRYSTAFGSSPSTPVQTDAYQPLVQKEDAGSIGPVEMVTVPAMGPEWQRDELRNMTKAGKREKNSESRRQAWKEWNRGHRGICGRWFTKKMLAVFLFVLCCCIGIVLAFTIPRVPAFAFNTDTPLANATGAWKDAIPTIFSRAPANFSFPGIAELQVDTSSNFLPLTFNNLEATIFDYDTGVQIGTGSLGHRTFPAKALTSFQIPLNFTYSAVNTSDPTWTAWYQACRNAIDDVGGVRPGVSFQISLAMDIAGLVTKPTTSAEVSNAACPVELPENAG